MKAMIWKELRENAKWGVLGAAVLALGTLYLVSQANGNYAHYVSIFPPYLTMTSVGAPVLGALLGLLQILPEQKRDQWAFLVHRPVSRSTIFGGKVIAGLIIYLLATGVSCGGAMLWALTPGHIAMPTDARMAWPGVVDILMGTACYFAGMLTGLRPARWHGSRALGLAAGVFGIFLTTFYSIHVWQALLCCAICAVVAGVTAWGSFLTDGEYEAQPKPAKLGLGTVMYCGILGTAGVAFALIAGIVSGFLPEGSTPPFDDYEMDPQGRVLRVHYDSGRYDATPVSATDLNGNRVPLTPPGNASGRAMFGPGRDFMWSAPYKYDAGYRFPSRRFITYESSPGETAWFYVHSRGQIEGYSNKTRRLIGSLGPDGFAPPHSAHADRFTDALSDNGVPNGTMLFGTATAVYRVNLNIPSVTRLVRAEAPPEVWEAFSMANLDKESDNEAKPAPVAVLIGNQIRVVTPDGHPLFTTPLRYSGPQYWVRGYVASHGSRYFLWYRPGYSSEHPEWQKLPSYVDELNSRGVVSHRFTLPVLPSRPNGGEPLYTGLVGLAAPPGFLAGNAMRNMLQGWGGQPTYADDWRKMPPDARTMWIMLLSCCVLAALASAAAAWQIGRRCAFSRREQWAWTIGVFWLGLFGLLTLLALRGWPAREVCRGCGQRRVVTREHCEHCGAEFPPPQPDGTEIFDHGNLAAAGVE